MKIFLESHWPHGRALIHLGLPLIGGHLAQMAIGLTDTVLLGWYGVDALAAVVLGQSLFMMLFLFGSGFAWAVMPMVAAASADGDRPATRQIARMGLWASTAFAILCMPLFIWSESVFLMLGQDALVAANAHEYLLIAGFGIFPALGVVVLKSFLAALEDTRAVLWITTFAALGNALFNWVLIFGRWGFPELGLSGAAIASVLTQMMAMILAILHLNAKHGDYRMFSRLWVINTATLLYLVRLGTPIGFATLAEVGLFTASVFFMGLIGSLPLAAHGIALQITTVFFMVQIGLSNAVTIRAGQSLARKARQEMFDGVRAGAALSILFAILASLCMLLFPEWLMGLFLDPDEPNRGEILELGAVLLVMAAVFQIVDGQQVVILGALRGLHDTQRPMIIATISYWVVGLGSSVGLGFGLDLGPAGIWIGLIAGLTCAAVLLHWRFWLRGESLLQNHFRSSS